MKNSWAYFCLSAFLLQIGCGGTTSKPEVSSVTVSPSAVALGLGQPAQFQAMVSGSTGGVVWSVNGTTGGNATVGTIDANGNYTAPTNSQSVEVAITATSASDPSASATAQAYVVAPGTVAATANPQVALYTIAPPAAANVTIQFGPTTAYGKSTWTQTSPAGGGSVGTFVAGMLASTAYHMQATVQFPGGITFTDTDHAFTTGAAADWNGPSHDHGHYDGGNDSSERRRVAGSIASPAQTGLWLRIWRATSCGTYNPGSSVPAGGCGEPDQAAAQRSFPDQLQLTSAVSGANSVMQEVDLAGQVIWQMTAAQLNRSSRRPPVRIATSRSSGHITISRYLPNGHLIVLAATQQVVCGVTVTGDVIIDLDQNHNPVWLWNEFNHLDINRRPYLYPDWTHTNAILYSPTDGDLIISIRHQNWLVKIDYDNGAGSGDIVWHLGYQGDFTLLNADGSADNNAVDWFYAEHGPSFTTTNTSGKFSDGSLR